MHTDEKTLFLDLHKRMLLIRLVEEKIAAEYTADWKMRCPVHLCIGQEAIAAGACAALRPDDVAMSTHRSHGHYLAKGGNVRAMIAEIYGKDAGCCHGKGGSMHLIDLKAGFLGAIPIVGSSIPLATGTAFASKMQGLDRVSVSFFGDAATEEGAFHESVQFAALHALPVVYVCEDNGFSVNTPPNERRPEGFLLQELVHAYGIPAYTGDGNDVVEVHRLTAEAVKRAREGKGPTFLVFPTYRWREHCGPNDDHHLVCRSPEDFERWKPRCPLVLLEARMREAGMLDAASIAAAHAEMHAQVEEAFAFAKAAPFPDERIAKMHVYAE